MTAYPLNIAITDTESLSFTLYPGLELYPTTTLYPTTGINVTVSISGGS